MAVDVRGTPLPSLLAGEFGVPFVLGYVISYMIVTMGISNVILAVYVDITMRAAKESEANTAELHARESLRIARTASSLTTFEGILISSYFLDLRRAS